MIPALDFILSSLYDNFLDPDHLADLRASGLSDDTIRRQRFRSVPPSMIGQLLGFDPGSVVSAMLLPFPDPAGGFANFVRMKVWPPYRDRSGDLVKYLQPRRSGVRLYFPLATLSAALHGDGPLWICEGEKKSLSVAQLGLPAVGFCGIESWHTAGTRRLISDFDHLRLHGRVVELVPDGDWRSNLDVERGAIGFAQALEARGARVRVVVLPEVAA